MCNWLGVRNPHVQLREAWKASGLTLAQLRKAAGLHKGPLKMSVVSLSRKLSGKQRLSDDEIAALATATGRDVTVQRVTVTLGGTVAA